MLAAASVAVAGVVEIFRKKELRHSGGMVQELAFVKYNSSHISIFAQIPQFALVGSSEVFTSITGKSCTWSVQKISCHLPLEREKIKAMMILSFVFLQ